MQLKMTSIKFDPELLPVAGNIFDFDEYITYPLFADETLSWFKEHNMNVYMSGVEISYKAGIRKYTGYQKSLSEMSLRLYASSVRSSCKLLFENENDAIIFKLAWS